MSGFTMNDELMNEPKKTMEMTWTSCVRMCKIMPESAIQELAAAVTGDIWLCLKIGYIPNEIAI